HVGVPEPGPPEDETEAQAEHHRREVELGHGILRAQASALAATTAVVMKTVVETQLARDPSEVPQMPWPEVHPPAVRAPKPMTTPATTRMIPRVASDVPKRWSNE